MAAIRPKRRDDWTVTPNLWAGSDYGLTLLDLREQGVGVSMTMSHVAARQKLRALLQLLLPGLDAQVPHPPAARSDRHPSSI